MIDSIAFDVSVATFHVGFVAACATVAQRWVADRHGSRRRRAERLAVGAVFLGTVMVLLAAAGTLIGPRSGFTPIRLVSQGLFAELPLLLVWLTLADWGVSKRRAVVWLGLAAGLVAVYWDAYHREPTDLQVRHHVVDVSHGRPAGSLRLLHLSDFQAETLGPYELRVLGEARRLDPDLVVWTGDYVQPRLAATRAPTEARLNELLRNRPIPARLGQFAVQGDVDEDWPSPLAGTSIRRLSNESATVALPGGRRLTVVGLSAATSRGGDRQGVCRALGTAPAGDVRLVLGHNPSFARFLAGCGGADLALAGHTHGGQVVLPLVGALMTKSLLPRRYASGLHDLDGIPLHVSAGIGMERGTAPQLRFGCPPEICLIEVRY